MANNKYFLAGSVVLAGLFIAGAIIWSGSHPSSAPSAPTGNTGTAPYAVDIKNVKIDGDPFIGQANAPVTIAFWSDYQCTFCKAVEVGGIPQFTTPPALPDIVKNYVDTGKVKIVFKDFQFLGADSTMDAEYARAVWELYPGKYFDWRTALYTNNPGENVYNAADNLAWILKTTATVSGIDANKVKATVTANKSAYDTAISADQAEAQKFGISGTPAFIIGTKLIAGAYPFSAFQEAIDPLLK